MATIMRVRFTGQPVGYSHPVLFQTFWRPGTSGGTTADATDCLARVRACLNTSKSQFSPNLVYAATTEVDALEDSTGTLTGTYTGADPGTVTGTSTGDNLPPQVAVIVKSVTNLIVLGRFLKGRSFLAGFCESNSTTSGQPAAGIATVLNPAFVAMLTGGATASFPVVWHRPTPGGSNGTSGPVINYAVDVNRFGSQRRRRP